MSIVWRDALSVGDKLIDGDHRHLIGLINAVEEALHEQRSVEKLNDALNELERYTRVHFGREEEIMILGKYPKYDAHKLAHRELIEELTQAAKPIRLLHSTGSAEFPDEAKTNLVKLLRHWLLDHIIKEDMQLKPLLHA